MKQHRSRIALAASAAVVVAVGLSACSGSALSSAGSGGDASSSAKSTVTFGVSAAQTGQYATYGEQFKQAFDLAVEQINLKMEKSG